MEFFRKIFGKNNGQGTKKIKMKKKEPTTIPQIDDLMAPTLNKETYKQISKYAEFGMDLFPYIYQLMLGRNRKQYYSWLPRCEETEDKYPELKSLFDQLKTYEGEDEFVEEIFDYK